MPYSCSSRLARVALFVCATAITATAQTLVADLAPGQLANPGSLDGTPMLRVGSRVYFAAADWIAGNELWITDGTAAGTRRVKDIALGAGGSDPRDFYPFGNGIVFTADDGERGRELWLTNGTTAGTRLLGDFEPGPQGSTFSELQATPTLLFFVRNGQELWATDGTNINRFTFSFSDYRELTTNGDQMLFLARTVTPTLLFVYDSAPVVNSQPLDPASRLLGADTTTFIKEPVAGGSFRLWAYTSLVPIQNPTDLGTFAEPTAFSATALGTTLLFTAGGLDTELYVSDGTPAGTGRLVDIWPGPTGSNPTGMLRHGNHVYFAAADALRGNELWRTDGTIGGTILVRDIEPGAPGSHPFLIAAADDALYFSAVYGTYGREVWRSDGTSAGTALVADVTPGPTSTTIHATSGLPQGLLAGRNDGARGIEPWTFARPGTPVAILRDIHAIPDSGNPEHLTPFAEGALLSTQFGSAARLWRTDGTPAGTVSVSLPNVPGEARVGGTVRYAGASFFSWHGQIWRHDWLGGIAPLATGNSDPLTFGSLLAFAVPNGVAFSDGTAGGTAQVVTGAYEPLAAVNSLLLTGNGGGLYSMGVGQVGPVFVASVTGVPQRESTAIGNIVFWLAGPDLWRTDGTALGTQMLASGATRPTRFGDRVVFAGNDGEPWMTDGTPGGTMQLADLAPSAAPSAPQDFTAVGNLLYFTADDGTHGRELFLTDGTTAGTSLVVDLRPGWQSSFVSGSASGRRLHPASAGTQLLFAATDGLSGEEVWITDGTATGTRLIAEVADGEVSSSPRSFVRIGDQILFAATHPVQGRELWSVLLPATDASVEFYGRGCPGTGNLTPRMLVSGLPSIGNAALRLEAGEALPGSVAILLYSLLPGLQPVGGTCDLLVVPPVSIAVLVTSPFGRVGFNQPIPGSPSLVGLAIHAQWAVLDPAGAAQGVATLSDAVRMRIGL